MAYIRQQFEPNQKQAVSIRDFSGGINNVSEFKEDNQLLDMVNMEYYDENVVERRRGLKADETINNHTSRLAGARFCDFYYPYNKAPVDIFSSETEYMISSTEIQYPYITNGKIHDGINYMGNYLFLLNDSFYIFYDMENISFGTYITQEGTRPGKWGVYEMLKVVTPSDGYTPLDTTHTRGVTHFNWTNMTVEYRPCQNELVDPYKGKNFVPQNCRYIADLKGRVYLSGVSNDDDNVFITDSGNPLYFPVGMAVQVPPDNDKIVGLTAYDDALVIFRQQDIYLLRGITNNPTLGVDMFTLQKLNTSTGLIAPKFFNKAQTYLFFVGYDFNVYALTSTNYNDKRLNVQKINKNVDLTKSPFSLKREDFNYGNALFHDGNFYIANEQKLTIYNFDRMSWHRFWTPQIWYMCYHPYDRIRFLSPTCWVMRFYDLRWDEKIHHTDMGAPFHSKIETKDFDFGTGSYQKLFKSSHLVTESFSYGLVGALSFIFDDMRGVNDKVWADLTNYRIANFGQTSFGKSRYIKGNRLKTDPIPLRRRAYRIRSIFEHGDGSFHFVINLEQWTPNYFDALARIWSVEHQKMYQVRWVGEKKEFVEVEHNKHDENLRLYQMDIEYEIKGRR